LANPLNRPDNVTGPAAARSLYQITA